MGDPIDIDDYLREAGFTTGAALQRARGVLVHHGGAVLRPRNAGSSRFSRTVSVRRGVYRVLVVVGGAQVSNYGQPLVIG